MHKTGLFWTSKTTHIDIDTGEIITKYEAKNKYKLIKINKHVEENYFKTKGITYYTKLYKKQTYQGSLFECNE